MDNANVIKGAWDTYRRDVMPRDAGIVQIRETKQAFYSGAYAVMQVFLEMGKADVPETSGAMMVELIRRELEQFMRTAKGGRDG